MSQMKVKSADRVIRPKRGEILLHNGDHMDQKTFHALYEQSPPDFKAELIGGVVYVPSPVKIRHGRPHTWITAWLANYAVATPGVEPLADTTHILNEDNEPQPDAVLRLFEEYGGQSTENEDEYIVGPPELAVEVAFTTATIDLHSKKAEYEKVGVREYLVVLSTTKQILWFHRGKKGFKELCPDSDGLYRSRVFPGLWLDVPALFERTPHRILTVLQAGLASPEHAAFCAKLEAKIKNKNR